MPGEKTRFSKTNQPKNTKKGKKHLKTLIREMLSVNTVINGKKKTNDAHIVDALITKAKDGDVPAFKALAERMEGMPKQEVETTTKEIMKIYRAKPRKKK